MSLRSCSSSHFIWSIKDNEVKKVHNMYSRGKPIFNFKKLEDIYQLADAECTVLPLAERETSETNGYDVEENEPGFPSKENSLEDLTLSQIRKKLKGKKRKASESVLLTPKEEDDDSDLTEPLCKFKVKVSNSSQSKRVSANGNPPTSSKGAQLATSKLSEDLATVTIKVEVPEMEYFESSNDLKRWEAESFTNEGKTCEFQEVPELEYFESDHDPKRGEPELFSDEGEECESNEVPEVEYFESNHDLKGGEQEFFTDDREECESNEVPEVVPEVDHFKSNHDSKRGESESFKVEGGNCKFNEVLVDSVDDIIIMEVDDEETIANVNQPPLTVTTSASDCSQSQLYLQQTPEQVSYISAVQDSDPTHDIEHSEDVASMEAKLPLSEENETLTSMNIDADLNSFSFDDISCVAKDISILPELLSTVPANTGSEVKFDHNDQTGVMSEASEIRQPERVPLTRKFISPNSQEKLCKAMKSTEPLDGMDHFKCKEKLYFGEQAENKFSSTKSDDEDNELNVHPQQATQFIQSKAVISSKHVLKRPRSCKKGSPTKKVIAPKGSLDGPRLCRSLPRFSTGCTSIEGCSESAIAFSQRQMHDIESLASKLLSELNSMKVIVEEKMLYEAYRSPSLKNEADEVKSAIKNATKTEETAKKWLSMMARDCNRFCKIMKLNEDHNTSASEDPALANINQEKPLEREKKKISFADEAGGTLCDIKIYHIEQEQSLA